MPKSLHVYHPSKSGKGFASSFTYSEKDDTFYASILKQTGWNEETQNGSFKSENPNDRVNVKLSETEVAGILDCIDRGRTFSKPHDTDDAFKQISFSQWLDKETKVIRGYSFSISVTSKQDSSIKNSFYIGLTFEEARLLREYLIFGLHQFFSKTYSK